MSRIEAGLFSYYIGTHEYEDMLPAGAAQASAMLAERAMDRSDRADLEAAWAAGEITGQRCTRRRGNSQCLHAASYRTVQACLHEHVGTGFACWCCRESDTGAGWGCKSCGAPMTMAYQPLATPADDLPDGLIG